MGQSCIGGVLHGFDTLFRQAGITGSPWVFLSGKVQQDSIRRFSDVRVLGQELVAEAGSGHIGQFLPDGLEECCGVRKFRLLTAGDR